MPYYNKRRKRKPAEIKLHHIGQTEIVKQTEKACRIRCEVSPKEHWIPKSALVMSADGTAQAKGWWMHAHNLSPISMPDGQSKKPQKKVAVQSSTVKAGSQDCAFFEFKDIKDMMEKSIMRKGKQAYEKLANYLTFDKRQEEQDGTDFLNHMTCDMLVAELSNPSQKRLKEVNEIKDAINLGLPVFKRRKVRSRREDGEELDPQAWLQRRTDGWTRVEKQRVRRSHVVKVAVNASVSCWAKHKDYVYRGAVVAALTDYLTQKGCSVQVDYFTCGKDAYPSKPNTLDIWKVRVKESNQSVTLPWLCLAIAELAFFRIVFFHAQSKLSEHVLAGHRGSPAKLPKKFADEYDIMIDCTDCKDVESAKKLVASLGELGQID